MPMPFALREAAIDWNSALTDGVEMFVAPGSRRTIRSP
jgi:hypothetical protein